MRGFYEQGPVVNVGDRFIDLDKRMTGRRLEVTSITQNGDYAYLVQVCGHGRPLPGRAPRIAVSRLLNKKLFQKSP